MDKFILAFDKYIFMKELQKNIDFAEKTTKFPKDWNKDKQEGYIVALKVVLKRVNEIYKNMQLPKN